MSKSLVYIAALLLFINGSCSYEYPSEIVKQLQGSSTPHSFGNFIEHNLANGSSKLISKSCLNHLLFYAKDLLGLKLWALQMFDASASLPSGLLSGNAAALGAFEQCLNVYNEAVQIRGKYCLGRLQIATISKGRSISQGLTAEDIAYVQPRLIDVQKGSVSIPWAVCLPDTCSAADFQFLYTLFSVKFSEDDCQSKESNETEYDGLDKVAIIIIAAVAALMIFSTLYDIFLYYNSQYTSYAILQTFSVLTNGSKLINSEDDPDEVSCIHGLRVISMVLIICLLTFIPYLFAPLTNWLDVFSWLLETKGKTNLDIMMSGDTFFVISGLFVSYNYLKLKECGKKINIFFYYLHRLIRLTPALGIAILLHASLLRYYGSGPIWPSIRDSWLVNNCRENWWASLLYVQNYVSPDAKDMCMLQTWQLSADMQLFLLSPILLVPLYKSPKITFYTITVFLICTFAAPFLVAGTYQVTLMSHKNVNSFDGYMKNYFFPTHTRAAAWLIGFLLGYFVFQSRKLRLDGTAKHKLNFFFVILFWILSISVLVLSVTIGCRMIHQPSQWVYHAFHMGIVRPAWSVAIAWVIYACSNGYGGPLNSVLSAPVFRILSKISYSTYLLSLTVIFLLTFQTNTGLVYSNSNVLRNVIVNTVASFGAGFVWTLAFESPLISVGKILFRRTIKDEEEPIEDKKNSSMITTRSGSIA